MSDTDLTMPTLFPIGDEIKAKFIINPCLPRFGVIAYWPKGGWWTIFDQWFAYGEIVGRDAAQLKAENLAQEKAKAGWVKCQVIFFEGLGEKP
jgi:hypothetical protein